MPHYKCVPCRTRLHAPQLPSDSIADLCPQCGSLLEQVGDLEEVIGYRRITPTDGSAMPAESPSHRQLADRVEDLIARRVRRPVTTPESPEPLEFDDDGPATMAVALPCPSR